MVTGPRIILRVVAPSVCLRPLGEPWAHDVRDAVLDVLFGAARGGFLVTVFDGLHQKPVFLGHVGQRPVGELIQGDHRAQYGDRAIETLEETPVPGKLEDGRVKLEIGGIGGARIARGARLHDAFDQESQSSNILDAVGTCQEPGSAGLEAGPQIVDLTDVVLRQADDKGTTVRLLPDQPLGAQEFQRLPDRPRLTPSVVAIFDSISR